MIQFTPDWIEHWTPLLAEQNLQSIGFKFEGEGWYLSSTYTMLVVASLIIKSDNKNASLEMYDFYVWSNPAIGTKEAGNPIAMLQWIVNAPIRVDTR